MGERMYDKATARHALTQDALKDSLSYDPDTGIFRWLRNCSLRQKGDIAGSIDGYGYRTISVDLNAYRAHRLAWLYVRGAWPVGQMDHINHIKDDNRIINLREATNTINGRNRPMNKNNTSGFTGVCFLKREGKFRASITVDGERITLGTFKGKEDAIAARQAGNVKYGFHENHGSE